jgi:tight adherence protein B
MNQDILLVVIFIATVTVIGLIFVAMSASKNAGEETRNRLGKIKARFSDKPSARSAPSERSIMLNHEGSALDRLVKDLIPRPAELRARLARTGKNISMGKYAIINAVLFIATAVIMMLVVGMPVAFSILLSFAIGISLPHIALNRMAASRIHAFNSLFPDAIDLIVRGLKSGLPITESIKNVAAEIPDPVGVEFQQMTDAMRLGQTMEQTMWDAAERVDTPDFKFFVICLSVQKETGGNLAETLHNLGDILRKRQQMKLKIKAMSSEGKASAIIVGAMPFVMFLMILSINYDYASTLFTDPRAIVISVGALIWLALGGFIMSKMVSFEI